MRKLILRSVVARVFEWRRACFIWVPKRHQNKLQSSLSGWWGHAAPFAMAPSFSATDGIRQALCGTQPIVSLAMVECGLKDL